MSLSFVTLLFKDYSKFLDDSFDAKEWINSAFKANKDSGATHDVW